LIIAGGAGEVWVRLEPETSIEIVALEESVAQGHWTIGRGPEAITRLRALADRLGYPVRATEERESPEVPPPRLVVVQRGETELAERLRIIARPGVPVIWDRRMGERRAVNRSTPRDRRRRGQDRRSLPPASWGALRFLIVRPTEPSL
jgi:hypothetical protein